MTEILTQDFQISSTEQSWQRPTRRATAILHRLTNTRLRYTGLSRIPGSSRSPLISHTCSGRPLPKKPSEPASSTSVIGESRRRRTNRQSNPHHQRRLRNRRPSHPTCHRVWRAGNSDRLSNRRKIRPVARSKPRDRRVGLIHSARRTRSSNGNRATVRNLRHAVDRGKFRPNRHSAARHRAEPAGLRCEASRFRAEQLCSYCW
jgi:hypothetical protein